MLKGIPVSDQIINNKYSCSPEDISFVMNIDN